MNSSLRVALVVMLGTLVFFTISEYAGDYRIMASSFLTGNHPLTSSIDRTSSDNGDDVEEIGDQQLSNGTISLGKQSSKTLNLTSNSTTHLPSTSHLNATSSTTSATAADSLSAATQTIKPERTANETAGSVSMSTSSIATPQPSVLSQSSSIADSNASLAENLTLITQQQPPRKHPHAGARFANGSWGYVADVTLVREWMMERYRLSGHEGPADTWLPLTREELNSTICQQRAGEGSEGPGGYKVLAKVGYNVSLPINDTSNATLNDEASTRPKIEEGVSNSTILCGVYTYAAVAERVTILAETYGWKCDGFFAASTATIEDSNEIGFGSVDIPHLGPEHYNNMWQKTRSILAYMHDNYLEDYDYFHLGGDDTMLLVENLRRYFHEVEQLHNASSDPLYIGQVVGGVAQVVFNGGGPGYILNRIALRRAVERFPFCFPTKEISAEDRFLGLCLLQQGIRPIDTADSKGQQRFHGGPPDWIESYNGNHGYFARMYNFWAVTMNHGFKAGVDLVSEQSIAFHFWRGHGKMRRAYAILYNSCPTGSPLSESIVDARNETTVTGG